jgi:hypothetical protein
MNGRNPFTEGPWDGMGEGKVDFSFSYLSIFPLRLLFSLSLSLCLSVSFLLPLPLSLLLFSDFLYMLPPVSFFILHLLQRKKRERKLSQKSEGSFSEVKGNIKAKGTVED